MIPIPYIFDNSMLSTWKRCPKLFYFKHALSRQTSGGNADLIAGGAYAKGMETFRRLFWVEKRPKDIAITEALEALVKAYGEFVPPIDKQHKSLDNMIRAFVGSMERFPPDAETFEPINGAIEMAFLHPIDVPHPEGRQVFYAGRFDCLVKTNQSNLIFVLDDKTTSAMGKKWITQWSMSAQLIGYTWAARELGYQCRGAIIRGVALTKEIRYEQVPVMISNEKIEQWITARDAWIKAIFRGYTESAFPEVFDFTCHMGKGCDFFDLCQASNEVQERMIKTYPINTWTPLP